MKCCSESVNIGKMQIKSQHCLIYIRMNTNEQEKMMVNMWGDWKTALLVRMQNGKSTVGSGKTVPQKIENRITI